MWYLAAVAASAEHSLYGASKWERVTLTRQLLITNERSSGGVQACSTCGGTIALG